jgi:transcription antitermination factor NusG
MHPINNHKFYWYVAVTYRKERIIKQELDKMSIKNFGPFRQVVKERNGKKVKTTQLIIPGYVFIYTDPKTSRILTQKLAFSMRYLKEPKTYNPITIPEKQMQDFIFLLTFPEEQTNLVPCNLRRGDKVRIVKGCFAGIEGELIRIKGHKRVVVRLENVAAVATTYIPASFLERIEPEA